MAISNPTKLESVSSQKLLQVPSSASAQTMPHPISACLLKPDQTSTDGLFGVAARSLPLARRHYTLLSIAAAAPGIGCQAVNEVPVAKPKNAKLSKAGS